MAKYGLVVGINNYGGQNLAGCVNDAKGWDFILNNAGYQRDLILDQSATRETLLNELNLFVGKLKRGDTFVFTYSGHGTYVADVSGDEKDGRDECLVAADLKPIIDDELYQIFTQRAEGSRIIVVLDSCFSGTATRLVDLEDEKLTKLPRFLPPEHLFTGALLERTLGVEDVKPKGRPRSSGALFSGCRDDQVSYDIVMEGRPCGAFSYYALKTYRPGIKLKDWHSQIREFLPSKEFDQAPMFYANRNERAWTL